RTSVVSSVTKSSHSARTSQRPPRANRVRQLERARVTCNERVTPRHCDLAAGERANALAWHARCTPPPPSSRRRRRGWTLTAPLPRSQARRHFFLRASSRSATALPGRAGVRSRRPFDGGGEPAMNRWAHGGHFGTPIEKGECVTLTRRDFV